MSLATAGCGPQLELLTLGENTVNLSLWQMLGSLRPHTPSSPGSPATSATARRAITNTSKPLNARECESPGPATSSQGSAISPWASGSSQGCGLPALSGEGRGARCGSSTVTKHSTGAGPAWLLLGRGLCRVCSISIPGLRAGTRGLESLSKNHFHHSAFQLPGLGTDRGAAGASGSCW